MAKISPVAKKCNRCDKELIKRQKSFCSYRCKYEFGASDKVKLLLKNKALIQFKNGMPESTKRKISQSLSGRDFSRVHKKRLSIKKKENWEDKSYRDRMKILNYKGKPNPKMKNHGCYKDILRSDKIKEGLKIYYKNGMPESTKKKIRASRKYQKNTWTSSIEIKIQNFLNQLEIEFFTHQYINIEHGYQCDILIPSMKTIIECDGDYWHNHPIGNDIDHIRTKELTDNGFKVLRLWEREIKSMDINKFNNILLCQK